MMIQVIAPHFAAGVILENKVVRSAAPILRYMMGWSESRVLSYCHKKNWSVMPIDSW